jgi:20S proteasome subunit alpha 6
LILECQIPTQRYGRRPFGVGFLMAGFDVCLSPKSTFSSFNLSFQEKGTHLYQLCPSANYYSCKCMAIGARSQSARTYLEKNLDQFADSNQDELIKHCMRALRDTLPNEVELTVKVCLSFVNLFIFRNKISSRIVLLPSLERIHHSVY